ncbi:bifunctional methylenetetrahydrofolate dehydrogenase/methenyltetrahydrofolate cyclohydrolase FolD [Vagococcus sp. PNs007]|uniref:Bifunctional protein FolD n=1 Tax=Vagococcus proximus TaxID=2991417 RepID=A0ABT5X0H9_9ENTE|nr:bifunctional methylenetetrahydrofolate dehydrogenase/methenyltetrahydrofolate cyclohydrolase FolD [Vagococcus proximus]MDF0479412.1 bifunctional methylenetetrahydrofolate dehydrogenase/methenyltetrahydrofolate cyclohydrolase FolD [Vagococcus proximus]
MGMIMNGRELADELQLEMIEEVKKMPVKPGLVVMIVGENPASQTYVKNKERAAEKIGINSKIERLPESITEKELLELIKKYNEDRVYHGILVQLPLPAHIDEEKVLLAIDAKKDVDGFHPLNIGKMMSGDAELIPCTPYGIMMLLKKYNVSLVGKHAVVVGRSNIVGKPMAHLLLQEDATVTITHSKTKDLKAITQQADVLVVAIGRGHFINSSHVKEGAVVIDVGMNRSPEGKLIGDVDFDDMLEKVSLITPVPKGVGPMTITMLMRQTIDNAKK